MINGQLRSDIDKLWLDFHARGIANPLSVIEQISFLMFARLLDIRETREEKKKRRTGKPFRQLFSEFPLTDEVNRKALEGLVKTQQDLRWSNFKHIGGEDMLRVVRDGVFPHLKNINLEGANFGELMRDAQLLIQNPTLMVIAVNTIDQLPLTSGDTKGDLYEYMLGKMTTAGIAGQFRTPRHIIKKMVEMLDPKPFEKIADPACGTAGFLVESMQYMQQQFTSPGMEFMDEDGNTIYPGDLLAPYRDHMQSELLNGFDFDATMLRIASMNMILHNIESPNINYTDTLSNRFSEQFPNHSDDYFDVILANPPFKGSLDYEDVHPVLLKNIKTKKTELLFLVLILKMLKTGGRSATIVPDGVLFGSSKAHSVLRKMLVDENQLEAVISLPSGVFKPYAGVSTAIIVFTKGGRTEHVFYYDVLADGFSLDDKREPLPDNDDLNDMLKQWQIRKAGNNIDRTQKHFFISAEEIRENQYDLSINRYKEPVYEEEKFEPPKEILEKIIGLEKEIMRDIQDLKVMLD